MKRFNSLQNISEDGIICEKSCINFISVPNILILIKESEIEIRDCGDGCGDKDHIEVKHQNFRKVKILQKTWDKVKTIIHPSGRRNSRPSKQSPESPSHLKSYPTQSQSSSAPSTPCRKYAFDFDEPEEQQTDEDDQVVKNYVKLQKRLSDELHSAIKEDKNKKDERISDDFKKKLQQWEMWKASTGKYNLTEEELQKLIPLDFSKKLQEWEELKHRPRYESSESPVPPPIQSQSGKRLKDRKHPKNKKVDESSKQKELLWLEKQLDKIEVEKKRLEREMVKYCEREVRLQRMREALRNNPSPKQEVWIKTPTAECKVEGVDEKFTKKLYKWEEKQGILPECSTMALLNPKYFATNPESSSSWHSSPSPPVDMKDELFIQAEAETAASPEIDEVTEALHVHPSTTKEDYSSHSESEEADEEEYEEATDSFATQNSQPASGASNTDSDCFNLKPSGTYRRRSSDAISTPLSARSPSPSCCTSDDEENFMLQTVNENEEEKLVDEKQPAVAVVKAKPIVVEDDDGGGASGDVDSVVFVKTQRTIFTPVDSDSGDTEQGKGNKVDFDSSLTSPSLVKNISEFCKIQTEEQEQRISHQPIRTKNDEFLQQQPPRVVGAVRKTSNASSTNFRLPPIPVQHKNPTNGNASNKPILGKIPVWCSPLMARRKFPESNQSEVFKPESDFSLDKFLESNSIPIPPPRPSRIPISSSPGVTRRKYTLSSGGSQVDSEGRHLLDGTNSTVRLLGLTRSSSFQGNRSMESSMRYPQPITPKAEIGNGMEGFSQMTAAAGSSSNSANVTKSKSTGSILGNSGTKGLFGFASKLVQKSDQKQKRQKTSWFKN